ncbi:MULTISPECIES: hypothetical protein [unclassified Herbaspirillum]|uniref:hypothetical protein n=1 Tax=unclassified Herbaspirillum TaxID=2624150 RepID=UPI0011538774|nr:MULTISPECIES: hypothetical protein [unclassified Herbaspirillum]MBB5390837.1 hypothetical protein [Herbaspirillum sp. SJZ102]TQK06364.1 hypothetical protein FB599_2512 [Herbaspirillum sp. SJZ130]TQK12158.1 hypothetical protein FB598_2107 [Herbaspirillum sp. SJZ106]
MKLFHLVVASPFILAGCASVAPYQAPQSGESSASLSIEFGRETGEVEMSYGKSDSDDCFEFSVLHAVKYSRAGNEKKQPVKQVLIPASGPQVLRYKRVDYNEYCEINLRFLPQQGEQYVLRTENRYLKSESELPAFFGGGAKRQCVVELYRKDAGDVLSLVQFDRLPIKPTRMGYPGCPKILTKMRSAFLVGSQQQFDLDTSGIMRRIP